MKDLTNKVYNSWTVIKEGERTKSKARQWLCRCSCGREFLVSQVNLTRGASKGCVYCKKHPGKHGLADKHPLYSIWKNMRSRCNNKNRSCYKYYGGRGIKICHEWDDFTVFLKDMGPSYKKGLTLERVRNEEGYSKENCKWATDEEQRSNKRNSVYFYYNGVRMTEAQLAKITNTPRTTIQARRKRGAKTTEEVLYGFK